MIAKLVEFTTDRLDLLAEDNHSCVALGGGAKLGVEDVDASVAVDLEELLKRGP